MKKAVFARFVQVLLITSFFFGLVALGAGESWPALWITFGAYLASIGLIGVVVLPRRPEIIAERGRRHEGTKPFDRVVTRLYAVALLSTYVVAGLDHRWAAAPLPGWSLFVGVGLLLLTSLGLSTVMLANPNLEPTVRIQEDRGHTVADRGPYRVVRHPMYSLMILSLIGQILALGSAWAFVPAALSTLALVVRTALEDRTLQAELAGYREFTARTRYRLAPGIW